MKQYLTSAVDNSYPSGQIGMFAEDTATPADVAFQDMQVWNL